MQRRDFLLAGAGGLLASRVIAQELLGDLRIQLEGQAGTPREGRRLLMQHEFDVLMVDIRLGDGSGFELIEEAKRHRSAAEIIVISALEDEPQVLHAFELGASGYLVKNAWFQSYAQAVLQVVNGGAAITPRLARRLLVHLDHKRSNVNPVRPPDSRMATFCSTGRSGGGPSASNFASRVCMAW